MPVGMACALSGAPARIFLASSSAGEYPRPELRSHARISGACLDAAMGLLPHLTIKGTEHPTKDGTCVRDYIHVSDLVAAHISAMQATANPPALFNVGTGRGVSVREFVTACKKVTGIDIKVTWRGCTSFHIKVTLAAKAGSGQIGIFLLEQC